MKCWVCKINEAIITERFGPIPCIECRQRQSNIPKATNVVEMTSLSIKRQRQEFFDDYHPSNRSGIPSAEYRDRWGEKAMLNKGFTKEEIKNAKPVWNSDKYYNK